MLLLEAVLVLVVVIAILFVVKAIISTVSEFNKNKKESQ